MNNIEIVKSNEIENSEMALPIDKIKFSKNDTRRSISVPKTLSSVLAEDVGFHIGDGYMKERRGNGFVHYELVYSGDKNDDIDYFKNILIPRKRKLFNLDNIKIESSSRNNEIKIRTKSKAILTFFRDVIMVQESPKNHISTPLWIFKSNEFQKAFIRGIIDSDGTLKFLKKHKNKHYYPVIQICTKSKFLALDIMKILKNLNFKANMITVNSYDKRVNRKYLKYYIDLNGVGNLEKWVKEIGFSNMKHKSKYLLWERHGYCDIGTTTSERMGKWWAHSDTRSFLVQIFSKGASN